MPMPCGPAALHFCCQATWTIARKALPSGCRGHDRRGSGGGGPALSMRLLPPSPHISMENPGGGSADKDRTRCPLPPRPAPPGPKVCKFHAVQRRAAPSESHQGPLDQLQCSATVGRSCLWALLGKRRSVRGAHIRVHAHADVKDQILHTTRGCINDGEFHKTGVWGSERRKPLFCTKY